MKKVMMMIAVCMLSVVSVAQTTESLSIVDFDIVAGETKSVSVDLTSETKFVAFQFDITLPEGLSVATNQQGRLDAKLNYDMADDHTLTTGKVPGTDNTYRFLCISMTNSEFYETSGTILSLSFQADANLPLGELICHITNVVFTERSEKQHDFDDVTFTITCKENTSTGINSTMADGSEKQVYTFDGKRVKTAQKGVNIIRQTNGTTRKVHIK